MKTTIITYAVKFAIAVLQFILKRYCSGKETTYVQDVQINEDASKMFKEFIDSHTKTVANDSDGGVESEENTNG